MNILIDLAGMDKAEVLARLYNASKPQGVGFVHYKPTDMTREEAQQLLDDGQIHFDYLYGRVVKIDLSGDKLDPERYDRFNGAGAAARALDV
jgi:hypothetical protein